MERLLDTADLGHMNSATCNPFAFAITQAEPGQENPYTWPRAKRNQSSRPRGAVSKQGVGNHRCIIRGSSCQIKVRTTPVTQPQSDRQELSVSSQLNQRLTRLSESLWLSSDPGWVGRFAFPFAFALALTLATLLAFTFGFAFTMVPKCKSIFHSRTFGMHHKMIWQLS